MSKFVLLWDTLLIQASDNILIKLLSDETTHAQKEIMKYGIMVMLKELSKIVMLLILFSAFGYGKDFSIVFAGLVSLRIFMGGSHCRTTIGCFIQSLVTFLLIIVLAKNITINRIFIWSIWLLLIICITTCAPVISAQRASYSLSKRRKFRIMALLVAVAHFFIISKNAGITNYIVICELIQMIEVFMVTIFNKQRKERLKNEDD